MIFVQKDRKWTVLLGAVAGVFLATAFAAQESSIVIEGGSLIDGTGAAPVSNAVIVIRGDRIDAAGPAGNVRVPAGARHIDAKGKFIIPGLVDAHIHLRGWMNELLIAHGVTSISDADSPLNWILGEREAIASGRLRGPRIYTAGLAFRCRLETCRAPQLEPDRVRQQVRELAEAGVNLIYVGQDIPPPALQAIIEEAHKHGLPVSGPSFYPHAAVEYGIDSLAHSYSLAVYLLPKNEQEELRAAETRAHLNPYDYLALLDSNDYLRLLLEKKVFLTPMLIKESKEIHAYRDQFRKENARILAIPELSYLPEKLKEEMLGEGMKGIPPMAGGRFLFGSADPVEQQRFEKSYQNVEKFLRDYVARGGKVLAGDDPPHFTIPGLSLHHELQLLVAAGLSPIQALQAGSLWVSQFLRKEQEVGSIRPGRFADLLILNGNPLQDIRNTQRIHMVIKSGRVQDLSYHRDFTDPVSDPRPDRY